jgi:hypothetical protein
MGPRDTIYSDTEIFIMVPINDYTKNGFSFFVTVILSNWHDKYNFWCRSLRTADTKNSPLFLVPIVLTNGQ